MPFRLTVFTYALKWHTCILPFPGGAWRRMEAVLTGQNGPGRLWTVTNRAGTALTGAVRTGRESTLGQLPRYNQLICQQVPG